MIQRKHLLYWFAILAACLVLGWAWMGLRNAKLMADESVQRLSDCEPLARQLDLLKADKERAEFVTPKDHQPGKLVADAFQAASIQVKDPRITVRGGRLLKDGGVEARHLEMPELERIDLPQLIRFLNHLQESSYPYHLERIVLTPNRENRVAGTPRSLWNAKCDLLFYVELKEE